MGIQRRHVSRRDLLKAGGALVVSFTLSATPLRRALAEPLLGSNGDLGKPLDPHQLDSFLAIHSDGSVTVYTGKVDLGTGLRIAMRQMAAEELGLRVERIALVEGDTGLTPDQGPTSGSTGMTHGGVQIRQAAATARQALLKLAAERMGQPETALVFEDGAVRSVSGDAKLDLGALFGGKHFSLAVDPKAPLKPPSQFKVIGQSLKRPDMAAKCTGTHVYIHDFAVPGMLHARTIRPPAIGAHLLSVDEASISGIPGARVVRIKDFLAVAAEDEWAAIRAARALKASWGPGTGLPGNGDLAQVLRQSPVAREETLVKKGDAGALTQAAHKLEASYYWPCQSHASMGPSCAVADVKPDQAVIWTASQATHKFHPTFAHMLDLALEKVRLVYLDGAGCYGMNGHDDAAADAALISKAIGKPVRVQWMREDEHGWDPKGPPQLLALRAGLDGDGRILAWETEMWLPEATRGLPNVPLLAPEAAGIAQPEGLSAGLISQNADPDYTVPNVQVQVHWLKDTPLRPSNIRAPGKIANVFAVEGFVDECAAAAKADPVEFRLRGLADPRGAEVLKRAAEAFGWKTRAAPNPEAIQGKLAIGRGIAYVHYKHAENYVAMAMEVAVDRASGEIQVRRVVCAHDCGLMINPDAVRNQVEGGIVQTLSRALHEEVTFDREKVTSVDWSSYPILTFPEMPVVETALIDRRDLPPFGAGEAATSPVAAALANAVFDATGTRLRTVPFTPERVKAALTGH